MFFPPMPAPGCEAPDFRLLDQHSHSRGLQSLYGPAGVVLLFFTTGSHGRDTGLLGAYRDAWPRLQAAGLQVAGVSAANWETLYHQAGALHLPYPLLFDACARVSMRYGAVMIPRFVTGMAVFHLWADGRIRLARKGFCSPEALLATLPSPVPAGG